MIREIGKLLNKKEITEHQAKQIGVATVTSAEEIHINNKKEQKEIIVEEIRGEKINQLKKALNGKTVAEKSQDLKKRTGVALPNFNITEKHASILIAKLLISDVK